MNRFRNYLGEVFWKPFSAIILLLAGFVGIISWIGLGNSWEAGMKILLLIALFLGCASFNIIYAAYFMYLKIEKPLTVKTIRQGPKYIQYAFTVILEKCDNVSVGDVFSIFNNAGDAEYPICIIAIETITSEGYPQGVLIPPQSDELLSEFINQPERLLAKPRITRRDIECLKL